MYLSLIRQELNQSQDVLQGFIHDEQKLEAVQNAALLIASAFRQGGKVISCGNGGSHCDAMHFAEELSGRYREDRPALPGVAISDASHLSCVSNDYGYEFVFSRYIEAMGNQGDVLIGFSGSGNSMNVVRAMETAHAKGMKTVTLTGNGGGKMAPLSDIEIRVDHYGYVDRIQEVHIKVVHLLILLIEEEMKK